MSNFYAKGVSKIGDRIDVDVLMYLKDRIDVDKL